MKTRSEGATASKVTTRRNDYTCRANLYEQLRFRGRTKEYLEMLRKRAILAAIASRSRESRILDVGCGTGRGLLYLASDRFHHITGLDYTRTMLDVAQRHLRERELDDTIQLFQGDAFALPWAGGTFDVVLSLNFLHMFTFELQRDLIREMARVCRSKGCVVAEFDSIHKGLFFTRYLEQRRVRHRTKFNSVWEVRRLFPDSEFSHVRVIGTALPILYRLLSFAPQLGARIESVTHWAPFSWLAERVIVTAEKR